VQGDQQIGGQLVKTTFVRAAGQGPREGHVAEIFQQQKARLGVQSKRARRRQPQFQQQRLYASKGRDVFHRRRGIHEDRGARVFGQAVVGAKGRIGGKRPVLCIAPAGLHQKSGA
jgi:hypothetical protein